MALDAITYLGERAPIVHDDGADAEHVITAIARRLLSASQLREVDVLHLLRKHWFPRCGISEPEYTLSYIMEARKTLEAERKAAKAAELAKIEAAYQEEHNEFARQRAAAEEERQKRVADADNVKKVMAAFKIGERQAQRLYRQGTSDPERALELGKLFGRDPESFMRERAKTGRKPHLARFFARVWVDDGTFKRFVEDTPDIEDDGEASRLLDSFAVAYAARELIPDHFEDFESFVECAQGFYFGDSPIRPAQRLWKEFRLWRIEVVANAAINEVDGRWGI